MPPPTADLKAGDEAEETDADMKASLEALRGSSRHIIRMGRNEYKKVREKRGREKRGGEKEGRERGRQGREGEMEGRRMNERKEKRERKGGEREKGWR